MLTIRELSISVHKYMGNMIKTKTMGNQENKKFQAGYRGLLVYKLAQAIYDLIPQFIERYLNKFSRNPDQVEQAARSGVQNIAEGHQQQGLKGYIKLTGVSRGSFEELLNDGLADARRRSIGIWEKEKSKREIGEIGAIWEIREISRAWPDLAACST